MQVLTLGTGPGESVGTDPVVLIDNLLFIIIDAESHLIVKLQCMFSMIRLHVVDMAVWLQVNASDEDTGDNARLRYEIMPGPGSHEFNVDRKTGTITAATALDRERQAQYRFKVSCINLLFQSIYDSLNKLNENKWIFTVIVIVILIVIKLHYNNIIQLCSKTLFIDNNKYL